MDQILINEAHSFHIILRGSTPGKWTDGHDDNGKLTGLLHELAVCRRVRH